MKRIIASVGLVAVGASAMQAANVAGLSPMETSKPWSISATLRGFYDDNYNTLPSSSPDKDGSFGIEVKPAAAVHFLPTEQTFLGLSYVYSMKWFEGRPNNSIDQSHEITAKADHRFSERYRVTLNDSFVYAQEPEIVDATGTITAPTRTIRTDADVIRNRLALNLEAGLTERFGLDTGYQNVYYDYEQRGAGSRSALLDRIEHTLHMEGEYRMREHLTTLLGYQFGYKDYTSNESIDTATVIPGTVRDNTSHTMYVGVEHDISSQLRASADVGIQYNDYSKLDRSSWNPYVNAAATYTYLPGSYVQGGFRHSRNATDIGVLPGSTGITADQETSTLFANVSHRITPQLTGGLLGQFQYSTFEGGSVDGQTDLFYILGLNLEYKISQNLTAETGYNFDYLDSDIGGRSFHRNRLYVGIRASY